MCCVKEQIVLGKKNQFFLPTRSQNRLYAAISAYGHLAAGGLCIEHAFGYSTQSTFEIGAAASQLAQSATNWLTALGGQWHEGA